MVEIPYKAKNTPSVEFLPYDGANFKTLTWTIPKTTPYKGRIIFLHGFQEDLSLYGHLFDRLIEDGFNVFFYDQRGGGETSKGADVGKTNDAHVFKDLEFMIEHNLTKREYPDEKLWLMGHSMGAGIIINYGIRGRHTDDIKGMIACAPLITVHPDIEPGIFMRAGAPILRRFAPNMKIDTKLKIEDITSRKDWQDYIRATTGKFYGTAAQLNDMIERGKDLLHPEYQAAFKKHITCLVIHGDDDHINWIRSLERFIHVLKPHGNKRLHVVKGAKHSIYIEQDRFFEDAFEQVLEKLNKYSKAMPLK